MVLNQAPGTISHARTKWNRTLRTGARNRQKVRAVPVFSGIA